MTDVVPYTRQPAVPIALRGSALEVAAQWANTVAGTDFVPQGLRNNPAAITAAILYGDEVGLGPMQALAKIAVINGRPTLAAEAQRALILAAGHDLWIEEATVSRCTVAGRRRDSEATSRVTWTTDDAKRANLAGKQAWRMYPRQMLLARASAELARAVFPDAIGGLAATEELEDEPELAAAGNGPPPADEKEKKQTRRRRVNVSAGTEPQPAPPPNAPPADGEGGLPPDEQAIVDQLQRDLGATPVEPEPEPPEPDPEPSDQITEQQRRKLHANFRDKGIDDRAARLSYCGGVLGREVPTSTDLTKDEASQILDHLDQYDPDDPQTWPLPSGF